MKIRLLMSATVVIFAAAASAPTSAQEVIYNPGYCSQFYPNANCQNKGPGNPYTDRRSSYRGSQNNWDRNRNDPGIFWPATAAAGIAGGAVGAAGAIATAPFQGGRYAYNSGYRNDYAARNGFVCQRGTRFKGADGRRHPCQ